MNNNLVSERVRAGMSRKEVAYSIGCSENTLASWERGETSPKLFPYGVKLAELYGCTIDYLSGLSQERCAKEVM